MDEFQLIKKLADKPLRTESEMEMVEIFVMAYNEHDLVADITGRMIKYANYPFKLTVINNVAQNAPINTSKIWNHLIKGSVCDYVGIFDSDVFFQDNWLKRMMESFKNPQIELVVPVLDNTSSPQARATQEGVYGSIEPLREILTGQAVIYRKSIFQKYGYFDERFLLYGQDSEWGYRFRKMGGRGEIRKDVFCHHIGGASLNKLAEDLKDEYNPSVEREYARKLFKYLQK